MPGLLYTCFFYYTPLFFYHLHSIRFFYHLLYTLLLLPFSIHPLLLLFTIHPSSFTCDTGLLYIPLLLPFTFNKLISVIQHLIIYHNHQPTLTKYEHLDILYLNYLEMRTNLYLCRSCIMISKKPILCNHTFVFCGCDHCLGGDKCLHHTLSCNIYI